MQRGLPGAGDRIGLTDTENEPTAEENDDSDEAPPGAAELDDAELPQALSAIPAAAHVVMARPATDECGMAVAPWAQRHGRRFNGPSNSSNGRGRAAAEPCGLCFGGKQWASVGNVIRPSEAVVQAVDDRGHRP